MSHTTDLRVYYEDTDAGGVVYYANYLRFAERARTEMLRSIGFENKSLADTKGILLVVRHIEVDYLKPAQLDDVLTMQSRVVTMKNTSFVMEQKALLGGMDICKMTVTLACVDTTAFKPVKLPPDVKTGFEKFAA